MSSPSILDTARHAALILVDLQPDFLPGGSLEVREGDAVLAGAAGLMRSCRFGVCIATQDWHPLDHVSFASNHDGRRPMETIQLHGHEQVLWPDHCVQDTEGARLHPDLPWQVVSAVIRKGMDPACDSYSAFRNNWNESGQRSPTGLAGYLRERGVEDVFLCGLARDYCVKWSAQDAAGAGFGTWVLWDLTRPVDPSSDASVRRDLQARGVHLLESGSLL